MSTRPRITDPRIVPEARRFDTVTLCLSKGLGCPLGALLAGSQELMQRAWREKHLFGGAMRQAGIVAAAPTKASSSQTPFCSTIGMRPAANGISNGASVPRAPPTR